MTITDNRSIASIQREFQTHFPFLKLEFYDTEHVAGEGSPLNQQYQDNSKTIGEIRKKHTEGDLSINGHLLVKNLEKRFYVQYGLNVQVFRKSGNTWLQTVSTDSWTLSEQNNKAAQYHETLYPEEFK